MAFVGGFLGGGVSMVPVGKHQVFLWWNTSDRENIGGVTYTLTPSSGDAVTVEADEYGRAETMVNAGMVYTVTVTHEGEYKGDGPQMLNAVSAQSTPILFYGEKTVSFSEIYPVGSIYMSVNSTDPSALFGGVWERIAQGRTLIGQGTSDKSFSAGATGGASTHKLTTSEIPSHQHKYTPKVDTFKNSYYIDNIGYTNDYSGMYPYLMMRSNNYGYAVTGSSQNTESAGGVAQQSPALSRCLHLEAHTVNLSPAEV